MSSLRKQGPITTGFSYCGEAVEQRLSKQTPRRMGPCFRRDDEEYGVGAANWSEARSRMLSYLIKPLSDQSMRAFREKRTQQTLSSPRTNTGPITAGASCRANLCKADFSLMTISVTGL